VSRKPVPRLDNPSKTRSKNTTRAERDHHYSQTIAHPKPTEPKIMNDTIAVTRNQPEEEKEANYFAPKNTIPRTPSKWVAKPTLPPPSDVTTPSTKYNKPEDISRGPKKKDNKLTNNPERHNAIPPDKVNPTKK